MKIPMTYFFSVMFISFITFVTASIVPLPVLNPYSVVEHDISLDFTEYSFVYYFFK